MDVYAEKKSCKVLVMSASKIYMVVKVTAVASLSMRLHQEFFIEYDTDSTQWIETQARPS